MDGRPQRYVHWATGAFAVVVGVASLVVWFGVVPSMFDDIGLTGNLLEWAIVLAVVAGIPAAVALISASLLLARTWSLGRLAMHMGIAGLACAGVAVGLYVMLLSGGQCGYSASGVEWEEPDFAAKLISTTSPDWTVRTVPPHAGIPNDDPDLAAWNATVRSVQFPLGERLSISLDFVGRLDLGTVRQPVADQDGLRDQVIAALAEATDGNETERRAWAESLLSSDEFGRSWSRTGANGTEHYRIYRILVPVDRIDIDLILAGNIPTEPMLHFEAGAWGVNVALPTVEATRGTQTFTADAYGVNAFKDTSWEGGLTQEGAVARFQDSYRSLGLGEPPQKVGVVGYTC